MHTGTGWCTHLVLPAGFIEKVSMSLESSLPNLQRDWIYLPSQRLKGLQVEVNSQRFSDYHSWWNKA